MQIIQWLFKVAQGSANRNEADNGQRAYKLEDIVLFNKCRGANRRTGKGKFGWKILNPFTLFLCRRDIAKTCFYSTLNLKRLGSFHRRQHRIRSMKMKKENIARGLGLGQKVDSGNKVLPIGDAALSASSVSVSQQCRVEEKKEKPKGDKNKSISRMKELLKWAAAVKSEKGGKYLSRKVIHFKNRVTLKAIPDDDQFSNGSPKISFRWDLESCSTTASAYSANSMPSLGSHALHEIENCPFRIGNWITTDSEFVVLEL